MNDAIRRWQESLAEPGRPDEHETKELLRLHGVSVPRGLRVDAGIAEGAEPDFDPPYVVKVRSTEILHKTDRGGVLTGIGKEGLGKALASMRERFPGCGFLVEKQLDFAGVEFILGAFRDPSFGPAVMAGAGGILTELYTDVAFRLVPCSETEALRMLKELRVFPVLDGYRGLPMDAKGLARCVAIVSGLVAELGDLFSQLDINPMVWCDDRWTALDAKLTLRADGA